ncbi:MAG: carboxypeptidase regulatory-like domain-containing protein [Spirochaetes bacterium]|nr:carboxypeptidase regulatory-like domain-containing protein [Spirochaetota bacterium]
MEISQKLQEHKAISRLLSKKVKLILLISTLALLALSYLSTSCSEAAFKAIDEPTTTTIPKVSAPSFSVESGTEFKSSILVNIYSLTKGAVIQYSYDNITWFTGTILLISETKTVYAKATKEGMIDSDVVSAIYICTSPTTTTLTSTSTTNATTTTINTTDTTNAASTTIQDVSTTTSISGTTSTTIVGDTTTTLALTTTTTTANVTTTTLPSTTLGTGSTSSISTTIVGDTTTTIAPTTSSSTTYASTSTTTTTTTIIDNEKPTIQEFTLLGDSSSDNLTINFDIVASDNLEITGWHVGIDSSIPNLADEAWNEVKPSSYTFDVSTSPGVYTIYLRTKDAAGNISESKSIIFEYQVISLAGYVKDEIGNPIYGALLRLYNEEYEYLTSSDVMGYYQFVNSSSGTYFLAIKRDGYTISTKIVVIP